jgi:hypothetical protein
MFYLTGTASTLEEMMEEVATWLGATAGWTVLADGEGMGGVDTPGNYTVFLQAPLLAFGTNIPVYVAFYVGTEDDVTAMESAGFTEYLTAGLDFGYEQFANQGGKTTSSNLITFGPGDTWTYAAYATERSLEIVIRNNTDFGVEFWSVKAGDFEERPAPYAEVFDDAPPFPNTAMAEVVGCGGDTRTYEGPDKPVVEALEWLTDIITARNGTEQRLALRDFPRVAIEHTFSPDTDEELAAWRSKLVKPDPGRWNVPLWGEGVNITQDIEFGDFSVTVSVAESPFPQGSTVLLRTLSGDHAQVFTVANNTAGTLTFLGVVTANIPAGTAWLYPCVKADLDPGASLSRARNAVGRLTPRFTNTGDRALPQGSSTTSALAESGSTTYPAFPRSPNLYTWRGEPVLLIPPLFTGDTEDNFDRGEEIEDNDIGVQDVHYTLEHGRITGARSYRIGNRASLSLWYRFLNAVKGRAKRFYAPSHRPDLKPCVMADAASSFETPPGALTAYIGSDAHNSLAFYRNDGRVVFREIGSISQTTTEDTVTLAAALPSGFSLDTVVRISWVNTVRLNSDKVTIRHYGMWSEIDLFLRTIEEN